MPLPVFLIAPPSHSVFHLQLLAEKLLRLLIQFPAGIVPSHDNYNYHLNKIVGNGKRFMTYEIIRPVREQNMNKVLLQLKEGLRERDIK